MGRVFTVKDELAFWARSFPVGESYIKKGTARVTVWDPKLAWNSPGDEAQKEAEEILERVRPSSLPSRHNIYVSPVVNNILFGMSKYKYIYRVSVTGRVFAADLTHFSELVRDVRGWQKGEKLPFYFDKNGKKIDFTPNELMGKKSHWAHRYWQGKESNTPENHVEWIVDGTAVVLDRFDLR